MSAAKKPKPLDVVDVLVKAASIFERSRGHSQCSGARDGQGRATYPEDDQAVSFSTTGAIARAGRQLGIPWFEVDRRLPTVDAVTVVRDALADLKWIDERSAKDNPYFVVAGWNDNHGTREKVREVFGLILKRYKRTIEEAPPPAERPTSSPSATPVLVDDDEDMPPPPDDDDQPLPEMPEC